MSTPLNITTDPAGQMLGTGFGRFKSVTGIDGLARDNGAGEIELLAVHAAATGMGQFRRFIHYLKFEYQTICVWQIQNPLLDVILPRYGFRMEVTIDGRTGDTLTGWRWDKQQPTV